MASCAACCAALYYPEDRRKDRTTAAGMPSFCHAYTSPPSLAASSAISCLHSSSTPTAAMRYRTACTPLFHRACLPVPAPHFLCNRWRPFSTPPSLLPRSAVSVTALPWLPPLLQDRAVGIPGGRSQNFGGRYDMCRRVAENYYARAFASSPRSPGGKATFENACAPCAGGAVDIRVADSPHSVLALRVLSVPHLPPAWFCSSRIYKCISPRLVLLLTCAAYNILKRLATSATTPSRSAREPPRKEGQRVLHRMDGTRISPFLCACSLGRYHFLPFAAGCHTLYFFNLPRA